MSNRQTVDSLLPEWLVVESLRSHARFAGRSRAMTAIAKMSCDQVAQRLQSGVEASYQAYSRGYAYLLSMSAAAEFKRRGLSRVTTNVVAFRNLPFSFDPSDPTRSVSIRSSDIENRQSRLELQHALADVLEFAATKVPTPDHSQLTSQRFGIFFVSTLDAQNNDVVTVSTAALR